MTRTSIKIIYLTLLWTLTCPFLQCFSPPNPLNYIALLTSIQSLQAISLQVSEESYDKVNEALRNNPNLLKQLIAQSGSSKSKLTSLPQGVQLMNGVSSIFPRFGTGMYSVKNPVTVALPEEVIINGQKYVLTNRLQRLGNFFKKVTSAVTSPMTTSFNYLKNVGQNQGVLPNILKSISNRLNIGNGNEDDEEEGEEEEEERPKKSKKKKSQNKKIGKKKVPKKKKSEEEEEDDEEEERPNQSKKKGTKKKKADEEEEDDEKDDEEEEDEESPNKSKKKDSKKKKEESDEEENKDEEGNEDEEKDENEDEEEEEEKPNKSKKKDSKKKKEESDEDEEEEKEKDEDGDGDGDEDENEDEDEDEDEDEED